MIKGLINSLVADHLFVSELGEQVLEDESLDFYDVLHGKLEELSLAGNLPIFTGFYTEILDNDEMNNKLDDKYVVRNCLYRNEMKIAAKVVIYLNLLHVIDYQLLLYSFRSAIVNLGSSETIPNQSY